MRDARAKVFFRFYTYCFFPVIVAVTLIVAHAP